MSIKDKVKNADTTSPEDVTDAKNSVVSEYNEKYAKVMKGGNCVVMVSSVEEDPITGLKKQCFDFRKISAMQSYLSNETFVINKKVVQKFKYWIDHPDCKRYSKVSFKPYFKPENAPQLAPDEFNMFSGYAVKPVNQGIDYPYLKHLIRVLTYQGKHESWFYDWLAFDLQFPEKKTTVAIVLKGEEGTGKGSLCTFQLSIHGNHGICLTQPSQAVGKFNAHLEGKTLVVLNEAFFAGDKSANGVLKGLISDYELPIERKGFDVENGVNHFNVMMSTNEDWAIPAGTTSRRYAVFDLNKVENIDALVTADFDEVVKDEKTEELHTIHWRIGDAYPDRSKGDNGANWVASSEFSNFLKPVKNFYTELNEELHSQAVKEQYLYDMTIRDIRLFTPNQNIPLTPALIEQRLQTSKGDTVASWLVEIFDLFQAEDYSELIIKDPADSDKSYSLKDPSFPIPNRVLYESYLNYCNITKAGKFEISNNVHFFRQLKNKYGALLCHSGSGKAVGFPPEFRFSLLKILGLDGD